MRYGLVGYGTIGRFFARSAGRLHAMCDLDPSRAAGFDGYVTDDLESLLARDVDAVIVATPNATHARIVRACVDAGKHVLCEKPLATDARAAGALVERAAGRGVVLMTAHHRRYNRRFRELVDAVHGRRVRYLHARYLEDIRVHSAGEAWYLDGVHGSGCITDNGVNVFDMLLELVGEVSARGAVIDRESPVPHAALITVAYPGGEGTIELDWRHPGEDKDIAVYLESGERLHCDLLDGFDGFKASLRHEYDAVVRDFEAKCRSGYRDDRSVAVMRLHDQVLGVRPAPAASAGAGA